MAEAQKMSQLVSQDRFQVVTFGMSAKRERRGKSGVGIAGIEINIRINNLAWCNGDFTRAELLADAVRGYHAGNRQHAGRKCHVRLIEAKRVQAIGPARCRGTYTRWRRKGRRN
jgi:hypothetical protein